jgi:hypothetical protein
MGHEVLFIEDSEEYAACYDPTTFQMTTDPSYGLSFIRSVFSRYKLDDNWAYFDYHINQWYGKSQKKVMDFLREADVLLNISGVNPLRSWVEKIPMKVFIDTDPVFTQVRHLTDPDAMHLAKEHNVFLTFGENYGKKGCTTPIDGFQWKPTRQPVVMDLWESRISNSDSRWTTIIQWDSYKIAQCDDQTYGMKSKSFESYTDLPSRLKERFELALGSDSAPKDDLKKRGWIIEDPVRVTKTPFSFQNYIGQSKGEWSIAKHGYVVTRSGWFSERSAAYLASSKPVVVQDTGFSENIDTGEGLFGFNDPEELEQIFSGIDENYDHHCKKSREICGQFFDHEKVLDRLLNELS